METEDFKIRAYAKSELALLYFPNCTKYSASNRLYKWIKESTELFEELKHAGYKPKQKILTPKQVEILINHFGLP